MHRARLWAHRELRMAARKRWLYPVGLAYFAHRIVISQLGYRTEQALIVLECSLSVSSIDLLHTND